MNNPMLGLDPVQATGFAAQMRAQASEVRGLVDDITRMIAGAGWFGRNATQFREDWTTFLRGQLTAVIETLENRAAELDRHAAAQQAISA